MPYTTSMKPTIDAVYISVHDMDRAISFYEELLEIPVTEQDSRMSMFLINDFKFLLYNPTADNDTVTFGTNAVVVIQVEDVQQKLDQAQRLGCTVSFPVTEIGEHVIAQVLDLDGNTIEFYQKK